MSMLSTQFEAAAVRGRIGHEVIQAALALVTSLNAWYERRLTLRYLQNVDDHILDDIGIRRTEILSAIYHGRNRGDA